MKKILVPTDFSNNAYAALIYATKLFRGDDVEITILHSFSDEINLLTGRVDGGRSEAIIERLKTQAEAEEAELLEDIVKVSPGLNHIYKVISTPDSLTKTVNKMVSEDGYSLVVMGTKGRTGAEDVLMGSTTVNMTKNLVGCPLLIVPRNIAYVIPANIVFASDYMEFYQLSKLKPLNQLVRNYQSVIHLVHVGKESELEKNQRENFEKFQLDLSEYDTEFHFTPKKDSISSSLHHFLEENNMEMLVLIYHKHNFIKQLFREPVVSRVGKHASIPTFVIPIRH